MLFRRITLTARRPSSNALCGFFSWRALFFVFFSETQVSFPLGTEEGAPQIGGLSVTDLQKDQITTMRGQGYGYATIAKSVGLKKDAVVAFCRKAGLTGTKATDNSRISLSAEFCPQCGAALRQTPGRKRVRFCSSRLPCRLVERSSGGCQAQSRLQLCLRLLRQSLHRLRQRREKILLSCLLHFGSFQRRCFA